MNTEVLQLLHKGTVIPAHPLALNDDKTFDEDGQRRLTNYYLSSGAGGVAVGVHTTQFEIRDKDVRLYEPVLRIVAEEIGKVEKCFLKVAGIAGPTEQAVKEAEIAVKHGYHFGLLSQGGLKQLSEKELVERAKEVAAIIPVFGFYLQPAVGGVILSYDFWRAFADIENVHAIKIAAFNRYQTIDVVRAVCESGRRNEIALYTGNDDNIITDLLTPYRFKVNGTTVEKHFVGGLLGHWAFCTEHAVRTLKEVNDCIANDYRGIENLLSKNIEITDTNAAVFDVKNNFKGSIAGIHEMLRRQGVMSNILCLREHEKLSIGQLEEIERICKSYFPNLL